MYREGMGHSAHLQHFTNGTCLCNQHRNITPEIPSGPSPTGVTTVHADYNSIDLTVSKRLIQIE